MKKIMLAVLLAFLFVGNAFALSEVKTNSLDLRGTTSGSQRLSTPATGGVDLVLPAVDGVSGDVLITDGAGNTSFANPGGWQLFTVSETAFTAAATSEDVSLFSLLENEVIEAVVIKHSTAFSGGTLSAFTVSVGIVGDLDKYGSAFDVFQATGAAVAQVSSSLGFEDFTGATDIRIAAVAVGDDVLNAAAGSVDVWVKTSILQTETP